MGYYGYVPGIHFRAATLLVAAFAACAVPGVLAQQPGGGSSEDTGGGDKTSPGPAGGDTNKSQGDSTGNSRDGSTSRANSLITPPLLLIAGRVLLANGSPPPAGVEIERRCFGQFTPVAETGAEGHFQFDWNNPDVAFPDVWFGSRINLPGGGGRGGRNRSGASRDTVGCDLRASLGGYRSSIVRLGRRTSLDRPDVGVILLYPPEGGASIVSVTLWEAPPRARNLFDKGMKASKGKKADSAKAKRYFERAVEIYQRFAAAWTELGRVLLAEKDLPGAFDALERAVEADANYVEPYQMLIAVSMQLQDWQRARDASETLLRLRPGNSMARYYLTYTSMNLGRFDDAEGYARLLLAGPDADKYPQVHHMMGTIYALRGDLERAAAELRLFLAMWPDAPTAPDVANQLRQWESEGKIVTELTPDSPRSPLLGQAAVASLNR